MPMGNYTKQIEACEERKDKDRTRREKLAGFFFDLSKIYMASVAVVSLSPIVTGESSGSDWISLFVGLSASFLFFMFGYLTLK